MRNFRNPRYAPESLESRLSPSTVTPVAVIYQADTTPATPPVYPHPGDAPPPTTPLPPLPTGPSGPA